MRWKNMGRYSKRRRRRGSSGFLYKLLSVLAICGCLIAALTLFFRVDTIAVSGQGRYTAQEIQAASGIQEGDNLLLLNKHSASGNISEKLPYIEEIRIHKRLPDTLEIEVRECTAPVAVVQDNITWLISAGGKSGRGKIVDQKDASAAANYAVVSGCTLLAPSVGGEVVLASEFSVQQESLLSLLSALDEADMLGEVDGIHLDDLSVIRMDYLGRFTVKLPYSADYATKMKILSMAIESDYVQDNMTGTFDMTREDGRVYLDQSTR